MTSLTDDLVPKIVVTLPLGECRPMSDGVSKDDGSIAGNPVAVKVERTFGYLLFFGNSFAQIENWKEVNVPPIVTISLSAGCIFGNSG